MAIFHDFQQVVALTEGHFFQSPVIQDQTEAAVKRSYYGRCCVHESITWAPRQRPVQAVSEKPGEGHRAGFRPFLARHSILARQPR